MSAVAAAARPHRSSSIFAAGILAVTFATGLATGIALARPTISAGRPPDGRPSATAAGIVAPAYKPMTPVLATTYDFTTIQNGILVPPRTGRSLNTSPTCAGSCGQQEAALSTGSTRETSPVLDPTRPYTTVQHGVVVPPGK